MRLRGKAQEVKCFVPILQIIWGRHMDSSCVEHHMIMAALTFSARIDNILDINKDAHALPVHDADLYAKTVFDYLAAQNACATKFQGHPYKIFDITVKSHYLAHSAVQAQYINPRCGWCYAGEDMMAKSKRLLASCVVGNSPFTVGLKCTEKYLLGIHCMATPSAEWI